MSRRQRLTDKHAEQAIAKKRFGPNYRAFVCSNYGKKGGTSATAGLKAETIVIETPIGTFTKRVYFGQRFAVVTRVQGEKPVVTLWLTHEVAEQNLWAVRSFYICGNYSLLDFSGVFEGKVRELK